MLITRYGYDSNRNASTEKAYSDLDEHSIVLCKTKQSIFICNYHGRPLRYVAKVESVLPERVKGDYDVGAVINYGDKTYIWFHQNANRKSVCTLQLI